MSISTSAPPDLAAMRLEHFSVGTRYELGSRRVRPEDLRAFVDLSGDGNGIHVSTERAREAGFEGPVLHGPFGLAVFLGLWFEAGIARDTVVGSLDTRWEFHRPILVGDEISAAVTITKARRTSRGSTGVVGRHVRLTNQDGSLVQSGLTSVMVQAGADVPAGQRLFERSWAAGMAERLEADPTFRSATATWDGSIGLRRGDDIVQFRIYRGRVIDAGSRTPDGPTFTVEADELTWAELVCGPTNDLTQRLMGGDSLRCTGSAYEYLRMTKSILALVDTARSFAQEDDA